MSDEKFSEEHSATFCLEEDLARLRAVTSIGALEATIFYAGRILEGLARQALQSAGIRPSRFLLNNLILLEQLDLVPGATRYWAHALRRLSNDSRHLLRRVSASDADLALVLTERLMDWFLQDSSRTASHQKTAELTLEATRDLGGDVRLRDIIQRLERPDADLIGLSRRLLSEERNATLSAPVLPAVLIQLLIDNGHLKEAECVLDAALGTFGGDVRLRQLKGLCLSRSGKPREALQWLEPLSSNTVDDPETSGILAGVYKRIWREDGDRRWLAKANQMYLESWQRTRCSNVYVGVNAAATLLWLDREVESRQLASTCVRLLEKRDELLRRSHGLGKSSHDSWGALTLAEALFLSGSFERARMIYRQAVHGGAMTAAEIEVATDQLQLDLRGMRIPGGVSEFLSVYDPPSDLEELVVAVTGQRSVLHSDALVQQIRGVLAESWAEHGCGSSSCMVALTPLAEGADRIFARCVLDMEVHSRLRVILPFSIREYLKDFQPESSVCEFQELLRRAESVHIVETPDEVSSSGDLGDPQRRAAHYEQCGRHVVDNCHVLVAIWDGSPPRGRGGTGAIVDYAIERGRQVKYVVP